MRFLIALLVVGALVAPGVASAADANVAVGDFFFRPDYTRIEPGDSVTWTVLEGSPHTATATSASPAPFDSGELLPGQAFAFTFTAPGRYPYLCTLHPFMKGVVQVGPDTIPPKVTRPRAKVGKRSLRVSFRLSETSRVSTRLVAVKRPGKVLRRTKARKLENGARSVSIPRRSLADGRYRATVTARDPEGNRGTAKVSFRVGG
jgi:plastocyanin